MEAAPRVLAEPGGAEERLRHARRPARRCRSRRSRATSRPTRRSRSTTRASSPRRRSRSTCAEGVSLSQATRRDRRRRMRAHRRADDDPRQLPGHGAGVPGVARQPAVADPRRAARRSTSCSACSTRASCTRSRSSRRCPRPASARCSRCCCSTPSSAIIALIGVILLIGIVKKNAIMMIDFALDAERERRPDAARRDLSRRACCASGRS